VFVTGATGFIGSVVLERLVATGIAEVTCLLRRPDATLPKAAERCTRVYGDIEDVAAYSAALGRSHAVVHLAAATGAASEAELHRVNVQGTRLLLDACKSAGVRRFIFMSSIAAAGRDLADYPYARSKLEGERAVRESGLDYTLLRPTIVLGERAPNWRRLRTLACLPLIPVFGGGTARVQPVDVVDVARAVELILTDNPAAERVVEIGGPEILTFADFLRRIRSACRRRSAALLPVPIGPVRALLRMAQRLFGPAFPVGPGQLAPFVNDGVAGPNSIHTRLLPDMAPLDEVLARLAHAS
jgi:NADH dehydrogenase